MFFFVLGKSHHHFIDSKHSEHFFDKPTLKMNYEHPDARRKATDKYSTENSCLFELYQTDMYSTENSCLFELYQTDFQAARTVQIQTI